MAGTIKQNTGKINCQWFYDLLVNAYLNGKDLTDKHLVVTKKQWGRWINEKKEINCTERNLAGFVDLMNGEDADYKGKTLSIDQLCEYINKDDHDVYMYMVLESMKKKAVDSGRTLGAYYKNPELNYDGVLSDFAPLFYNKTRECLVGYRCQYDSDYETYTYPFVEMYVSGSQPAEKSKYGFGMEPVSAAEVPGDIIPDNATIVSLFKPEYESEVKQASRVDLFKFDRFEKYFPLVSSDKKDNLYKLETDRPITLKVEANWTDYNGVEPKSITIGLYYEKTGGETEFESYYELNGEILPMGSFVPLFYNEVKGCLVGYVPEMEKLVERYCDPNGNGLEGYGDIALERYGL